MTKTFLFISFLLLSISVRSQTSDTTMIVPGDPDSPIYATVDSSAEFPGGHPAWVKFIRQNIDPAVGLENGAKKGTYKVIIAFTVTKDGTLKTFQPITKFGYGFEEEVIRVLKLSPNWIPGKVNGEFVSSLTRQTQIFVIH